MSEMESYAFMDILDDYFPLRTQEQELEIKNQVTELIAQDSGISDYCSAVAIDQIPNRLAELQNFALEYLKNCIDTIIDQQFHQISQTNDHHQQSNDLPDFFHEFTTADDDTSPLLSTIEPDLDESEIGIDINNVWSSVVLKALHDEIIKTSPAA